MGLVDRLRAGDPSGMGRVFLGESPGGRKVAIKVVHPHYASDPEFRRRFATPPCSARRAPTQARARTPLEPGIDSSEHVGGIGSRRVVRVGIDPADPMSGIRYDDRRHRQPLSTVGVEFLQVQPARFVCSADLRDAWRHQDPEFGGEGVTRIRQNRELEIVLFLHAQGPIGLLGANGDEGDPLLDEARMQLSAINLKSEIAMRTPGASVHDDYCRATAHRRVLRYREGYSAP